MFDTNPSINSSIVWKNILKNRGQIKRDHKIAQKLSGNTCNQVSQSIQRESICVQNGDYKEHKVILRQDMNYIQKISRFLAPTHIYNIFDNLSINEQALKNQNHDESLLKTVFYSRFINRVETNKDYVSTFVQSNLPYVSLSYVIERFNSFGDQYFHKIANYITLMKDFMDKPATNQKQQKTTIPQPAKIQKQMESFLETLHGKAYLIKFLPNNFIFSNEMLRLVGMSVEDFSNECLKFKCIVQDFFTSENYKYLLQRNCRFFLNFIDFQNDKMSLKQLIQSSSSQSINTIRDRKNHLIKVKIKTYMPNPLTFCMEFDEILQYKQTLQCKEEFKEIKEREYVEDMIRVNAPTVEKILTNSNSLLRESNNDCKQCGYMAKPKKRSKRIDPNYQI